MSNDIWTVGSLFSGIGGMDLGCEMAGMEIRWQIEIDPWCRRVLAKHWPEVRRYEDVRQVDVSGLEAVDVVCAGFPCQPFSVAGMKKGIHDERWLWPEVRRVVSELRQRPRAVVIENVPGLFTTNGGDAFGEVVGDLAAIGFDCEWEVISAQDVGAPHLRKRVWIVAHSQQPGEPPDGRVYRGDQGEPAGNARASVSAGTEVVHAEDTQSGGAYVADTDGAGCEKRRGAESVGAEQRSVERGGVARRVFDGEIRGTWAAEPNIRRVSHGVPNRVDRLRGLGNAVVPQVVAWIMGRLQVVKDRHGEQ